MTNLGPASRHIQLERVDRKTLRVVRERFDKINEGRLVRTSQGLTTHQRSFLRALSLIVHLNHPLLPGYVSRETPAGIHQYIPSRQALQATKQLFRNFKHRSGPHQHGEIESLFLMGSTGTVAHAGGSDMDVWVCHSDTIALDRLTLLNQKLSQISIWAKHEIALDVCFFTMNAKQFRDGIHDSSVNDENCGSAQHYLLLDEFYRSSLLLAGRYPIWWLINPNIEDQYDEYVAFIHERKFIRDDETIDFGKMPTIPAGEFVGAGIWQLYKAIDSPFKSVIKMILIEAYAAEHPLVNPVSIVYKQLVHDGVVDLDTLDPYLLVLQKIEIYLLNLGAVERLTLARECFYLKTKIEVTRLRPNEENWRKCLMARVTNGWQMSTSALEQLDNRRSWDIREAMSRKKALVREMNGSYRFLLTFAKQHRAEIRINTNDIILLGRKLHAAFDKRRGKIEKANPKIAPEVSENTLNFLLEAQAEDPNTVVWSLTTHTNLVGIETQAELAPLKRSRGLVELITWAHFNLIYRPGTQLHVQAKHFSVAQITRGFRLIEKHFPKRHTTANLAAFEESASIDRLVVVLEFSNPFPYPANFEREYNYDDPLNQLKGSTCAVNAIDFLTVSSWQETICHHFSGSDSIIQMLSQLLIEMPQTSSQLTVQVESTAAIYPDGLRQRVQQLLEEFYHCFQKHRHGDKARFIVQVANQLYGIQTRNGRIFAKRFKSITSLMRWLGEAQIGYSPIVFESYTLQRHPLAIAAPYTTSKVVQVFYEVHGAHAEVYIFDEFGSLSTFTTRFSNDHYFITHTYRFLMSVIERQTHCKMEMIDNDVTQDAVEFFELYTDYQARKLRVSRQDLYAHLKDHAFIEIIAIMDQGTPDQTNYRIYCDDQEFAAIVLGEELYLAVARYVVSLRTLPERYYPIYLTDIDLSLSALANSASSHLQISQYLQCKLELEKRINLALLELKNNTSPS